MKPPKGFRTYKLQPDPTVVEEVSVPVVTGTLAVQLNLTTSYKPVPIDESDPTMANLDEEDRPMMKRFHWKLTLRKLSNLFAMHETEGTNPYCEIYWQGMVENKVSPLQNPRWKGKHKPYVFLPYYEFVGQTKTIFHILDYEFNQEEANDSSYYEFPPIYSPKILPNRYNMLENSVQHYGGGYISKHLVSEIATFHEEELKKLEEMFAKQQAELSNVSLQVENIQKLQAFREKQALEALLQDEIMYYMGYLKTVKEVEERERSMMGQEDYKEHQYIVQKTLQDYEDEILLQDFYLQEYSKLVDQVIEQSGLLKRLKFIMGIFNERERMEKLNIIYSRRALKKAEDEEKEEEEKRKADALASPSKDSFVKPSTLADILQQASVMTEESSKNSLPERLTLASLSEGGGLGGVVKRANPPSTVLKVRVEDPSSSVELYLMTVPIQTEEDEQYLSDQLYTLIGKHSFALIKVMEFSIHDITNYNAQGYASMTQRTGIIIMEYFESIQVLEYLRYLASMELLSNESFRDVALLCISCLVELHAEGMIHRNLTPFAFQLQTPDMAWQPPVITAVGNQAGGKESSIQKTMNALYKKQNRANASVMVKLGDYWFLENPRPVGAKGSAAVSTGSEGMADWGSRMTAPPEVFAASRYGASTSSFNRMSNKASLEAPLRHFQHHSSINRVEYAIDASTASGVTDRSDVYAFGVCIFYWATNGMQLPPDQSYLQHIDSLQQYLPNYWGPWVLNVLRMCLAPVPSRRASAKEIQVFLQNRLNK
jgi:serine/threonine protein kinase